MKRLLLGSTVLIAGGTAAVPVIAADPINMGVGGYYLFYALAGAIEGSYALNGSSVQYKGLQFIQEGEIHFIGQTRLDNGSSVGVRVEMKALDYAFGTISTPGSVRQIDEAYLYAFGDWGRLEFGAKDDPAYIMYYGSPSALLGFGFIGHQPFFYWTNPTAASANVTAFRAQGMSLDAEYQDANRINVYSPRFGGLQIGVGYAPKIQPQTQPGSIWGLAPGPGTGAAGICGFSDATTANGCPTYDNTWQDALAISANYLNKFGDVAVALYGGYTTMNFVPGFSPVATAFNSVNGANLATWQQAAAGLQFSYQGFTVGGSYLWNNNGLGRNGYTGIDNDTRAWSAAALYETGPWQVSAGFSIARNDNGNGVPQLGSCAQGGTSVCLPAAAATSTAYFGTNQNTGAASFGTVSSSYVEVGVNYALGPGIKLTGGVVAYNLGGPSSAVAGQSWATLIGMDFRY